MAQLGQKGLAATEQLLNNSNEQIRAVAYKALLEVVPDRLPYAKKMATDPSAFVRREVLVSLHKFPFAQTKDFLPELIKRYDGEDRWYLETIGFCLQGNESTAYPLIKKMLAENTAPGRWNKQMTTLAWRLHPPGALNDLLLRAKDTMLPAKERQQSMTAIAFMNTGAAASAMLELSQLKEPAIKEMAAYWLSFRQSNDWYALLDWRKLSINTAYERKLAQMKVKRQIILDEDQSPDERKYNTQQMAADSVGGQLLIGLAAENKLPKQLLPFVEEKIFNNPDPTVRVQAGNFFKRPGSGKVYAIPAISKLASNPLQGQTAFAARCASCHQFNGVGKSIGPELTAIGKKFGKDELLDAMINPSAAIVFGYEPWLVNMKDGESVFGLLVAENKQAIVIKDISGNQHTIAVNKIASKKKQAQSLMPDPENNGLTEQNLADIAAYLLAGGKK